MNTRLEWKGLTTSNGTEYLYYLDTSIFVLTDLSRIYSYHFPNDVLARNEEINPSLEFSQVSDVFDELHRILESKDTKKDFKGSDFEVEDTDDEIPFGWTFNCKEEDADFYHEYVTKSLLQGMHRLWEERSLLLKVIKDKDAELDALYLEDGANLTRKSLKTKRFNQDSVHSIPEYNPFRLLTSKSYQDFFKASSKSKPTPSYRNVEKRLKMTSDNIFDENDDDQEQISASSTPTSSPRKSLKDMDDKARKKNETKKKLKKF